MNERDILYIEDEDDFQLLVRKVLERAGLGVRVASTGAEGLAALREKRPDLLILDINLPDTDGYAICRQLREDCAYEDLPILMLTVRRRPEEWLRGFSCGATDYISKPINPPELVERVVSCLTPPNVDPSREGTAEFKLIQAAVAGNRSAFQVMIEQYRTRLKHNVRSMLRDDSETEEVVSRAFIAAYEKMAQFRGEASFFTWLYRIAMHEITALRRETASLSLDAHVSGSEKSPLSTMGMIDANLERWADQELIEKARVVLAEVPRPSRKLLELYFLRDYSYEDIAKSLKMPIGTVMSRLFRARHHMRVAWDKRHPVAR